MPDGLDLTGELFDAMDRVAGCIDDMHALGAAKSEAERKYRIAKRKRILYERDHNKTPVSIIADVVKGYEDIAQLAFERDCAEAEYDANYEAILFWKKRADVLRELIAREWSEAGR